MTRLTLHHRSADGLMCYRPANEQRCARHATGDLACAGSAEQIVAVMAQRPGWHAYGSPTQPDGVFVAVAPGIAIAAVPLECGKEPWVPLSQADVEEFTED